MLDTRIRPLINRPLNATGLVLAQHGVSANGITLGGLLVGLLAALAIAVNLPVLGFVLIVINRVLDGLDGAVARATTTTDSGGYLDIVADYVFYASVPFAFALADPGANAVAAAALLAAFCLTGASFLTFATIAAKRGLETEAHGKKSFFYSTGIIEGTETIMSFLLMAAFPAWFAGIAWVLSLLCVLTVVQRSMFAMNVFRNKTPPGPVE